MIPLPDETAGSLAFRLARNLCLPLIGLCQQRLGLTYQQARSDLDRLLPERCLETIARISGMTTRTVGKLLLPSRWTASVAQSKAPSPNRGVRLCPLCLSEYTYGRRFWRTRFAAVCTKHSVELIDSCPNCGKPIPYFGAPGGFTVQFWLENWPICPSCLNRIDRSLPTAPELISVSRLWHAALCGKPQLGFTAPLFLEFSSKLIARFENIWRYQVAAAMAFPPSRWAAHLGTAAILRSLSTPKVPESVFYAALGMPFDPSQLANEIVSWPTTGGPGLSEIPSARAISRSLK